MGFLDFISQLFGNKASRDANEIRPWVEKIKAVYPQISVLSNDQLRERSAALKAKIQGTVTEERRRIDELKASIEGTEIEKREAIFNQIDKLEKEVLEKLDKALDEALPEAFAIVRKERPDINLYHTDNHHQSMYGSYLKSCVNYLVMFGEPFGDSPSDYLVEPEIAAYLRSVAEKTVL